MNDRTVFWVLVLSVFVVGLADSTLPSQTSPLPQSAYPHVRVLSTPQMIQTDTVAYKTASMKGTFWQNGSAVYNTGSAIGTIPTTLSPVTPASVYSYHLTAVPSFGADTGTDPQIGTFNFTQGSGTLVNLSITSYYIVNPAPASSVVKAKVPSAYTSNGGTPSVAQYPFWLNYSIEAHYLQTSSPTWTLKNGSTENLSYVLAPPTGFQLNQSYVTVPLPIGVNANQSTLTVQKTVGSTTSNVSTYYFAGGAVVVLVPGANAATTVKLLYTAQGQTIGATPIIQLGPVAQNPTGLFEGTASWINPSAVPWGGEIIIQTNQTVGGQIVPQSLNVTANHLYLRNNTFVVAGNSIVILPGSVTVWGGRVMVFDVKFAMTGLAPSLGFCLTCGVFGPGSVPWSVILLTVEFLLAGTTFVRAVQIRNVRIATHGLGFTLRHGDHIFWSAFYLFFFVLVIILIGRILSVIGLGH